eukprot:1888577-Rhodomonas_salina.3
MVCEKESDEEGGEGGYFGGLWLRVVEGGKARKGGFDSLGIPRKPLSIHHITVPGRYVPVAVR